jgi:hypothetical protein
VFIVKLFFQDPLGCLKDRIVERPMLGPHRFKSISCKELQNNVEVVIFQSTFGGFDGSNLAHGSACCLPKLLKAVGDLRYHEQTKQIQGWAPIKPAINVEGDEYEPNTLHAILQLTSPSYWMLIAISEEGKSSGPSCPSRASPGQKHSRTYY